MEDEHEQKQLEHLPKNSEAQLKNFHTGTPKCQTETCRDQIITPPMREWDHLTTKPPTREWDQTNKTAVPVREWGRVTDKCGKRCNKPKSGPDCSPKHKSEKEPMLEAFKRLLAGFFRIIPSPTMAKRKARYIDGTEVPNFRSYHATQTTKTPQGAKAQKTGTETAQAVEAPEA